MKRTGILYFILVISVIGLAVTLGILFNWYLNKVHTQKQFDELKELITDRTIDDDDRINELKLKTIKRTGTEENVERRHSEYDKLYERNKDFIGWIKVPDTNIDYPVVQCKEDEEYYLHRDFDGNYNYAGVPFCDHYSDVKSPSDIITIFAHHMRDHSMFQNIMNFTDKDFFDSHEFFIFDTIYRSGVYKIVAVVRTDITAKYWEYADCNEERFNEYKQFIQNNAIYKSDAFDTLEYGDLLVTLSTCAYHVKNGRMLLIGKMVDTDDLRLIS